MFEDSYVDDSEMDLSLGLVERGEKILSRL